MSLVRNGSRCTSRRTWCKSTRISTRRLWTLNRSSGPAYPCRVSSTSTRLSAMARRSGLRASRLVADSHEGGGSLTRQFPQIPWVYPIHGDSALCCVRSLDGRSPNWTENKSWPSRSPLGSKICSVRQSIFLVQPRFRDRGICLFSLPSKHRTTTLTSFLPSSVHGQSSRAPVLHLKVSFGMNTRR